MAIKIYEDGTTKELVISRGSWEDRYPAFSELKRTKVGASSLEIKAIATNNAILDATLYSDLQDSGGTPYASYAALKTEMDKYFDATL